MVAEALNLVPNGSYFTDFFGAVNLPRGMAELLSPLAKLYPWGVTPLSYLPPVLLILLCVVHHRSTLGGGVPRRGE